MNSLWESYLPILVIEMIFFFFFADYVYYSAESTEVSASELNSTISCALCLWSFSELHLCNLIAGGLYIWP